MNEGPLGRLASQHPDDRVFFSLSQGTQIDAGKWRENLPGLTWRWGSMIDFDIGWRMIKSPSKISLQGKSHCLWWFAFPLPPAKIGIVNTSVLLAYTFNRERKKVLENKRFLFYIMMDHKPADHQSPLITWGGFSKNTHSRILSSVPGPEVKLSNL